MIVHASGPQNITLSPPIKTCGFKSVIKEKKSKFKPIARGIRPKTAVKAAVKAVAKKAVVAKKEVKTATKRAPARK